MRRGNSSTPFALSLAKNGFDFAFRAGSEIFCRPDLLQAEKYKVSRGEANALLCDPQL
jgi:hypothetical protein